MKVLCVNATVDPINGGGTAERTFQLCRYLAKQNHDCRLLTMDIGLSAERRQELANVELIALPCLNRRYFVPAGGLAAIRGAVEKSDIVHIMGHWTVLNVLVAHAARKSGTPYVCCPAGALPIYGRSRFLKRLYNKFFGHRLIRDAQGWIAISADEPQQLEDYGVDTEQVVRIPNGIDPDVFQDNDTTAFRQRHQLGDSPFILFLGRLNSIKGPDLLLDAFIRCAQKYSEYQLVFAGPDSGMQDELQKKLSETEIANRVNFIGYLGGAEKSQAYHAADLLVIPSRQEAMSIVVLEAGITATPVLLTDQCGFNELAEIGGGAVVPATVAGLDTGLQEMLSQKSQLLEFGKRLREYTLENYRWDTIVNRHLNMFREILRKKPFEKSRSAA